MNPTALLRSGVLLLEHLGEDEAARRMEDAIAAVIAEGKDVTYDLGGTAGTPAWPPPSPRRIGRLTPPGRQEAPHGRGRDGTSTCTPRPR